MDLNWYGSIAGIAGAAAVLCEVIKRTLGDKPGWNQVPTVVYALASCVALSAISHYVMGVVLAESFPQLLVLAGTATLVAVGGVSFASNVTKPMAVTAAKLVVALALTFATIACARPVRVDGTPVSPEAEAAANLNRVVLALDALTVPPGASPVEKMVDAKLLTLNDAIEVAKGIKTAQSGLKDAGLVLQTSLAARTAAEKERGLARVAALVRSASDGLRTLPLRVGSEQGRIAVADLLALAANLLLTVGSVFPAPSPVGA